MGGPVMGGRGSAGRPLPRPAGERIRAAYQHLAARPGELVSLARLRDELPDLSRADLDAVLLDMDRRRELQLEPDPHRLALTQRAKDAAIRLGGEDMHLFTITGPPPDTPPDAP
ncbi:hypothetical protein [Mangrovihabitans endophyticus]|uniref:Uncharacterized protein n=1 Tax=Mangrovihabitans endophyticus TaxID=1751298 RepID=A0A8J3FSS5_9ACTN|nr:hypothetical protein [Mangrovihabitans endophyticus]GGL16417.1 hypothetical protein GCM10012284_58750 [Mangrovihabitans endophyticus]